MGGVFRDDFGKLLFDCRGIGTGSRSDERFDVGVKLFPITASAADDADLLVRGRNDSLSFRDQFFVQFLPGPESDVLDRDIPVRFESVQADHIARHIGDADGFPISRMKTSPPSPIAPA